MEMMPKMNFHFEEIEHGDIKFFFVNPHILRRRFQKLTQENAPETPSLSKLDFLYLSPVYET